MTRRPTIRGVPRLVAWGIVFLFATTFVVLILKYWSFPQDRYTPSIEHSLAPPSKIIVFPKDFKVRKGHRDLVTYYLKFLNGALADEARVFKYQGSTNALTSSIKFQPYHEKIISLFHGPVSACEESARDIKLEITNASELNSSTDELAEKILDQISEDDAFRELRPFFQEDIRVQIAAERTRAHFFKFAGSSVFLQQFGVHLMVSRVIYSASGNKKKVTTSLLYAQLFDSNWNELKDIELIVPLTNHDGTRELKNLRFPQFLPIPFFHDVNHLRKRFYGPEDPRLILIKNSWGEQEPVIIYNSFQRKLQTPKAAMFGANSKHFRAMFLAWPFRVQKGKGNVQNSAFDYEDIAYTKVSELVISGTKRSGTQKNWSPMLNSYEAKRDKYHRNIYFLHRWSDLVVLRCSLEMEDYNGIPCNYDYKSDDTALNKVGPLRGGTELININDIVHEKVVPLIKEKQIWVGFPRTHLNNCGCGKSMYRPNLAVVMKEADRYRVAYLSSFTSFDIQVVGWARPEELCAKGKPNVLLPNGISTWTYDQNDDYLTLTLSVADSTNHLLHIKGLLSALIEKLGILRDHEREESNRLIGCSIAKSTEFCKIYGDAFRNSKHSQ